MLAALLQQGPYGCPPASRKPLCHARITGRRLLRPPQLKGADSGILHPITAARRGSVDRDAPPVRTTVNGSDAPAAAETVLASFDTFHEEFRTVTRRAAGRFARGEWRQAQQDARERLAIYPRGVGETVSQVRSLLGPHRQPTTGTAVKRAYEELLEGVPGRELRRTFFNSVMRRVFAVVGVDPRVEYLAAECLDDSEVDAEPDLRVHPVEEITPPTLRRVLDELPLAQPLADPADAARRVAAALHAQLGDRFRGDPPRGIELLRPLFYRNKGAYAVGRIVHASEHATPLVFALLHPPDGVAVDAVLTTSAEASILFGFSRSYFHVEVEDPASVVGFLRTLMPLKRVDELYTSLGFNKHGKTRLYRDLMCHLEEGGGRFERAEGERGLVMTVFTLPSYNVVFKVIKDRFGYSKETSRRAVMAKYRLVFAHDRVGRLADAQEFEGLRFPRDCFSGGLLEELRAEAGGSVHDEGERVVIDHLYTERRVRPLNLHLWETDAETARRAVVDYGYAIRDLAAAGIFPGDLLLKNFGVSRHGRVIFYDYDELALLADCRFRRLPQARSPEDEMRAQPWFSVEEGDVFPEEWVPFLIPPGPLRDTFLEAHAELLTVDFWREMQARQERGEIVDVFPYGGDRRLA